jgi:hypothetical protein
MTMKKMTWMKVHTLRNVSPSGVACKAIVRGTTRKRNKVERNNQAENRRASRTVVKRR